MKQPIFEKGKRFFLKKTIIRLFFDFMPIGRQIF
jgi:hypothetical protein